ncbi:hypothetical protein M422DRAFT_775294 [Sphaerobolus stellatus SS14]|nr:hypothetical protein M422DRAFT_775294 [Sphaerobolus stellatus SS14]
MGPKTKPTIVVDNGAHTIKAGLSTDADAKPKILYNAAIRSRGDKQLYIGQEFEKCRDYASLTYRLSFERGYLTDWDVQKAVWDNLFGKDGFSVDFPNTSLLITEPPFNPRLIQEKYDQLIFEEYEFGSYARCPAAALAPHGNLFPGGPYPDCSIIIDSGFSFTHVIPMMHNSILWNGVRRIDVGGKLLTNHLSTLVSFRQWNMLDQTYIVNDVKEKCCYISSTFNSDLERCRKNPLQMSMQYVLPDFSRNRRGYVWDPNTNEPVEESSDEKSMEVDDDHRSLRQSTAPTSTDQVLYMTNERFSVPELIFSPTDIGLQQAGLAETVADAISVLPEDLQGLFWANIGLIGGNSCFPGFSDRLRQELRCLAPVEYDLQLYEADDPITQTYTAAHAFANSPNFASVSVTREEYNEGGSNACRRKFRSFDWDPLKEKVVQAAKPTRKEKERSVSRMVSDESEEDESEEEGKIGRRGSTKKRDRPAISRPRRSNPKGR